MKPRLAVTGIRGIPANFGGSETAVEEIGSRLVQDGYEATVYCRRAYDQAKVPIHRGMRRVVLPSARSSSFATVSHSLLASLHILVFNTADVVHFHGVGNGLLAPLFRFSRKKVVITIDGPDWNRPKWGFAARLALRAGAVLGTRYADELIIDNHPTRGYWRRRFGSDGTYIPYGADRHRPNGTEFIQSLGLQPRGYLLFVGALVPDKGPDILLDAYKTVPGDMPLIIVGDSPFAESYRKGLEDAAANDDRVRMMGYVWGSHYRELVAHAYAYIHPLRSDGTSPALLQAMKFSSCIIVNSLPESLAAVGDAALPYKTNDPHDLSRSIAHVLADPDLASTFRERAADRAAAEFDWDRVTQAHADLYLRITKGTND